MFKRLSSFRIFFLLLVVSICRAGREDVSDLPDGYFPFEESPTRTPPKVRRPPYAQADIECPGMDTVVSGDNSVQSLDNLCGDLNKGYIPKSPMGRNVHGQSYPFELIRNKTLDFFSSTLPILKADNNLPKVAKYEDFDLVDRSGQPLWKKRAIRSSDAEHPVNVDKSDLETGRRQARGLCDKNYGIVCTIMNMINGRLTSALNPIERVENPDLLPNNNNYHTKHSNNAIGDEPLTPCPSAAEYVTPVYAKNYQGVWRYVVQIPYEGYFTQTVEVTKCLRKKCHFMDGSCLASPRWVSLLVAELFYPHARFPATKPGTSYRSMSSSKSRIPKPPSVLPDIPYIPHSPLVEDRMIENQEEQNQDQANESIGNRDKRQVGPESATAKPTYCDGVDEIGCFQVRLYYDWLLVPGSCKCWKQDFFTKYGRK